MVGSVNRVVQVHMLHLIGLIRALVAQQVRGNIVDLDTGGVVQHLQVLEHRGADLFQVLRKQSGEGEGELKRHRKR
ncbi:hypothetical protein JZ751_029375 [Albula glossodonta]|uniref:Secreted protein n=1 Tax=Albula glossodonta TaxID=121402 RepID=A0A8T2PJH9_9TELE|nr:hypothetical protein JZ751_029375 [Albula glossodonta]